MEDVIRLFKYKDTTSMKQQTLKKRYCSTLQFIKEKFKKRKMISPLPVGKVVMLQLAMEHRTLKLT